MTLESALEERRLRTRYKLVNPPLFCFASHDTITEASGVKQTKMTPFIYELTTNLGEGYTLTLQECRLELPEQAQDALLCTHRGR